MNGKIRQRIPYLDLEVPTVRHATGTRSAFAHAPIKGHIHLSHPKGADHLGNAKAIPPHHFMVGMIWNRHDETQAVIAIRRRWRMRRHERSEEHTSELQSLMRISYAVFCLKQKTKNKNQSTNTS